jgi:hypothetical protein
MSTTTSSRTSSGSLGRDESTGDLRRMAPIYIAVVIVEVVVLSGLWWFQQHFS